MDRRRAICGLIFFGLLAWFAGAGGPAKTNVGLSSDEETLKQAGIPLDDAALLDYFRRRTPTEQEQTFLKECTLQLGSQSYPVRAKATTELIRAGRASLPALRLTLKSKDPEIARRAQH